MLDKIISFDDHQQSIYDLLPPLIVIGSAGSGKTTLTLEKMKQAVGDVLYVTQSPYLVKNSLALYYAHHYDNPEQQIDFLSFQEFLESIQMPTGKPVTFHAFQQWFSHYRQGQLKDAHKLFEEFRGVITGPSIDKSWLSLEEYLNLGVKESIFLAEEREAVYSIFENYLVYLQDNHLYDSNIVSHQYLQLSQPRYDFIIVDEVHDLTNIQLYLIIKSLRQAQGFILCGDSNQIVHPNFFSW
jgi:superfamily I DNA/RNA helicase